MGCTGICLKLSWNQGEVFRGQSVSLLVEKYLVEEIV